jgi:hypothetical protein
MRIVTFESPHVNCYLFLDFSNQRLWISGMWSVAGGRGWATGVRAQGSGVRFAHCRPLATDHVPPQAHEPSVVFDPG